MDPSALDLMKADYVDPELAKIMEQSPPVSILNSSVDLVSLRKLLSERKRAMTAANQQPKDAATVTERDMNIPTRNGPSIVLRIYQPSSDSGKPKPVMVMLHGGGWVLGDLDSEALLCRKWCDEYGGVCVNVGYRLAPEHKFPTAVYDCYDAVLWTADNADSIGGNLETGFIVAGVSAGANMAAVVAHLWRDEAKVPPLTGVYLSIPSTLSPEAVPDRFKDEYTSREQNKKAPILDEEALSMFRSHYQEDYLSPLMSPAIFSSGHENLPNTYLQICGMDPLRDEGLIYEKLLRESGVQTKVDHYPGLPHAFWTWWPDADFSKAQFKDSLAGFSWLLQNQ